LASLSLGIVGAVIGGGIGHAPGARLGFSIGVALGGILFAEKPKPVDVGRLSDYPQSGSQYGSMIPLAYGTVGKMPGNIIECTPLAEHSTKKGSKLTGASTRTYSYTTTLAVMFARGPIGIQRIWAEDRVIYDYRAYPPSPHTLRVYRGSALQGQDSALVALHGASVTPAYRNRVYCVIETLNLADWGNRIPVIAAELSDATYPERVIRAGALIYYRFDDSDGKLSDSGTKGYTLTDTSPASPQVRGCFTYLGQQGGEGIQVAGGSALQRTVGNDAALQVGTISVETWYQYKGGSPSGTGANRFRYRNPVSAEFPWELSVQPDLGPSNTVVQFRVFTNASGTVTIHNYSVARDTNWHHAMVTYTAGGTSVLYVDGVAVSTQSASVNPLTITGNAANLVEVVGGDYKMDELAFYGTALSAADALAHFQSGAGLI
jgi:hypothetical protein